MIEAKAPTGLAEARRLFPQAQMLLSAYPGVIGVGVGEQQSRGVATGRVAFIVTIRHPKDSQPEAERLPRELLGIQVDVQVEPELPTLKTLAGGQPVQQAGQPPPGRLGCLVKDAQGRVYGLTAMHVLIRERGTEIFQWSKGPFFDVDVNQGLGPRGAGKLRAGQFTRTSDIACVELATDIEWQSALAGGDIVLAEPADPETVTVNSGVALVPSGDVVNGTVAQYPYAGEFLTDAGVLSFTNLMKFSVMTAHGIRNGWSGSVLFDSATLAPLALLSFGSSSSDGNGRATAYGFPLFAFYAAWRLRPV